MRIFKPVFAQIDIKNCTIRVQDQGGTNFLDIKVGEGNINYTEKRNIQYYKDRGLLDTVRTGDEEPLDLKLEFTWEFLKTDTGTTPTLEEVLKHTGPAASWVSTASDPCEPYCVDMLIINNPPCAGVKDEAILLPEFHYEQLDHDIRAGSVSLTGKCNATMATITRTVASTN